MAATTDTTYEEAKRCPKCGNPGEETTTARGPHGSTVHTFTCRTELCRWYNTGWVVQVNADGSIPLRGAGEKDFPDLTPGQEAMARAMIEQIEEEGKRDTGPGTYYR